MALAENLHHSAQRPWMASAGEWGHEVNYTATIRDPPTPQPELFSLQEEPGRTRPDRIATLSGPQERVLRRTVQQIVDAVPSVPILDDPAPRMVEQLPDVMHFFDTLTRDPVQVIEVSKILLDDVPMRTAVRVTQLAEQMGEVPSIVSLIEVIRQPVEQLVDSPVPRGRVPGPQGFLPGQSYSLTAEQIVDNPVPRLGDGGCLQGLHRAQSSTAFSEQIAEYPDDPVAWSSRRCRLCAGAALCQPTAAFG